MPDATEVLTGGRSLTDALAAGAVVAVVDAPMLLLEQDSIPDGTGVWLVTHADVTTLAYLVGGTVALDGSLDLAVLRRIQ